MPALVDALLKETKNLFSLKDRILEIVSKTVEILHIIKDIKIEKGSKGKIQEIKIKMAEY